jgi:GMP synthase (glutamine-hydrolysing)
MTRHPSFLLLQVRNPDDPMREHEIQSFARSFRCDPDRIRVFDLLSGVPSQRELGEADIVLLGGSGDYSVAKGGPWLPAALETMRRLHDTSKPTFASCWGFQAMARALGGEVVTDRSRAEVGTLWLELTPEGKEDPVFGPLGDRFRVHIGHEDIVTRLPEGATLLASSDTVENEAFCFDDKPVYCTQFHPELDREGIIARITQYPSYLPLTGHHTVEEFSAATPETSETEEILRRFVTVALAGRGP